jgi:hypothetical protein
MKNKIATNVPTQPTHETAQTKYERNINISLGYKLCLGSDKTPT